MTTPGVSTYPNPNIFGNRYGALPCVQKKRISPTDRDSYPTDSFPPKARELIYNVSHAVGCPVAAVGAVLIGVCSICCQSRIRIRKTGTLVSPTNLWILTAQSSGERKTSLLNMMLKPVREYEKRMSDEVGQKLRMYALEMELWEDKKRLLRKQALKNQSDNSCLAALKRHEELRPIEPKKERLIHESATIEALLKNMGECSSSTSIITDEFSCIAKSRMLNQVGMLCKTFEGADIFVDKVVSGASKITDALTTLLIMGQPDVIEPYVTKHWMELDSTGFLPRILFSSLKPTAGDRLLENKIEPNMEHLEWFNNRMTAILMSSEVGKSDANTPIVLNFSPDAEQRWKEYHDSVESSMKVGDVYERFRAYASRGADKVARLSALLHYAFCEEGPIQKTTLESCITIIEWYNNMYVSTFGIRSLTSVERDVALLGHWLVDEFYKNASPISVTRIMQYGPKSLRRKSVLDAVLHEMENKGLVKVQCNLMNRQRYVSVTNNLFGAGMNGSWVSPVLPL